MFVFCDTNYYVGLANPKDSTHLQSLILSKLLKEKSYTPIISNFIFLETVTIISQRVGREKSILFGEYLRNKIETIKVIDSIEQKTWDLFKRIKQKDVSFVDCSTLVLLKEKKIKHLVTFDSQFEKFTKQFGFSIVS